MYPCFSALRGRREPWLYPPDPSAARLEFVLERLQFGLCGLCDRIDAADFIGKRFVAQVVVVACHRVSLGFAVRQGPGAVTSSRFAPDGLVDTGPTGGCGLHRPP
jgi:hypothetical protein